MPDKVASTKLFRSKASLVSPNGQLSRRFAQKTTGRPDVRCRMQYASDMDMGWVTHGLDWTGLGQKFPCLWWDGLVGK